jgi:hypothetical protein
MPLPTSLPLSAAVLGSEVAVVLMVLFGLFLAQSRLDSADVTARRVAALIAGGLVAWLLAAIWLARVELFRAGADGPIPPFIAYGTGLPILIGIAFILRSRAFGRILAAIPQHWLVGVQLYRTLGIIFLVSYADGLLPGVFAIPAGYGDILVGLSAVFVAYLYAKNGLAARRAVIGWNVLGIADLVVAVTLGTLSSPGPLHVLSLDNPNVMISAYPLVMVPIFAVPLSILLHVCSLTKLSRDAREQSEMRGQTAYLSVG